jgi:hypothetical protein
MCFQVGELSEEGHVGGEPVPHGVRLLEQVISKKEAPAGAMQEPQVVAKILAGGNECPDARLDLDRLQADTSEQRECKAASSRAHLLICGWTGVWNSHVWLLGVGPPGGRDVLITGRRAKSSG